MRVFFSREQAGQRLGERLATLGIAPPASVIGLPRGGVPVAREVARVLRLPWDVLVVRKVGMPDEPELAIAAVAQGGVLVETAPTGLAAALRVPGFAALVEHEQDEVERRLQRFRPHRPPLDLQGHAAILVDDGIATGATMRAAVRAARALGAREIIVAAPVASHEACRLLEQDADRVVVLDTPPWFEAVSQAYLDFPQVSDAEVRRMLEAAA